MNRILKYAWYQLIVILASIVLMAATIGILYVYWYGKEFNALILFWPLLLIHFYRVFFPLKASQIAFDERDETIMKKATRFSFIMTWYLFAAGCLIPVLIIGNGSIQVSYLGIMVFVAAILTRLAWSISVIVQYGRTGTNDNTDTVLKGEIA